jgi:hypothetical protein
MKTSWLGSIVPVDRLISAVPRFHFKDVRFFGFTVGDTFIGVARVRRMTEQDKADAVVSGLSERAAAYASADDVATYPA